MTDNKRRNFIKNVSILGAGITMVGSSAFAKNMKNKCIGIVGMDTSHSPTLVKAINGADNGYKVTTAFSTVSLDFPPSADRVDMFTKQISDMGVEIVPTLDELLEKVDYVLLLTVDGRRHLEQAKKIFKAGKKVFIDKPIAASLKDVIAIFDLSKKYNIPTFTSSAVRFMETAQEVRGGSIGKVLGASTFAPVAYQPTLPALYWYGIHGIELLFTLMQTGCQKVKRQKTEHFDLITGNWGDGRIGTYRGLQNKMQQYGGQAFGEKGVSDLGRFKDFEPLHHAIIRYFETGEVPVTPQETIEIFAFMDAAHQSSKQNGAWISILDVLDKVGYKQQHK